MQGLRTILNDRGSRSAMLLLTVLLLVFQSTVAGAMSVSLVTKATGDAAHFVICSPLSETGLVEDHGTDGHEAERPCPLCRLAGFASLPAPVDPIDLGPAFALLTAPAAAEGGDDIPVEEGPFSLGLSPDRTGPPTGSLQRF